MLNKILIASFIALAAVVVIEVVYLFFYNHPTPTVTSTTSIETQNYASPSANSSLNVSASGEVTLKPVLASHLSLLKNLMISSAITNEFKGVISQVLDTPGRSEQFGFSYQKAFGLKPINGGDVYYLFLGKGNLTVTKVYEKTATGKKEIKLSDLKVGDTVIVTEVADLLNDIRSARTKIEILKI